MTKQQRIKCLRCDLTDAVDHVLISSKWAWRLEGSETNSDTRRNAIVTIGNIKAAMEFLKKAETELMFLRYAARERKK